MDFDLAVTEKIKKIEETFNDAIKRKCLENKEKAELTSFAYYECAEVNAVVKGGKIISVIEEIKIFE